MATLPQRDIFNFLAMPILAVGGGATRKERLGPESKIEFKNVEKLLRLRPENASPQTPDRRRGSIYIDLTTIEQGRRFLAVNEGSGFELLSEPNSDFMAGMPPEDLLLVQSLWNLILTKDLHTMESFSSAIYSIAKDPNLGRKENSARQLRFFRILYRLMFGADSGPNLSSFLWETDVNFLESLIYFSGQDA